MSRTAFQTIICGQSLAARLCAVLLARRGEQVLLLCPERATTPTWGSAAPLLVRFLDLLDARSCLQPATPLQVLTPASRLELHGGTPFKDELRREFPHQHELLTGLFASLERQAQALNELLWTTEGYPLGPVRSLLTRWRMLRSGLRPGALTRPFSDTWPAALEGPGRGFLEVLFGGLALCPVAQLSCAEAALIWAEYSAPQTIALSALEEILKNRLHVAVGRQEDLPDGTEITFEAGHPLVVAAGESQYHATQLLLDLPGTTEPAAAPMAGFERSWRIVLHKAPPSPLLSTNLLYGDDQIPALRVSLEQPGRHWQAEVCHAALSSATPELLLQHLRHLFPFAEPSLQPLADGQPLPASRRLLGLRGSFRTSTPGVWCLSASTLFPTLSLSGECLAAMTLAASSPRSKGT